MADHDDLTRRLRRIGSEPVDRDVRDEHLRAMHAADHPGAHPRRRFGRLAVAGAAIAGFALGSTGFALAGALPAPAQGVAHDVLSVVQVDVPDRPANRGACVSQAAKAATPDAKAEAKAACASIEPPGRSGQAPGHAGADRGRSDEAPGRKARPEGHPNADTGDCKGKPPWAGRRGGPAPEELAEFLERCPERAEDADPDDEDRASAAVPGDDGAPTPGVASAAPGGAPPAGAAADPNAAGGEAPPAERPPLDVPVEPPGDRPAPDGPGDPARG